MFNSETTRRWILGSALSVSASALIGCADARLNGQPPSPPTVNLKIQNYCPKTGYLYKDHFVYNAAASFNGTTWTTDSDYDGLPDSFEQDAKNYAVYGTNWLFADTLGNNYSDLLKVRMNLAAAQQASMPICNNPGIDTDGDGLTDCEEILLGTDPTQADHDLDGIPDGLELRYGSNPLDLNDAYTAITGDGISNLTKIKMGVGISTYVGGDSMGMMPNYQAQASSTNTGCFDLFITNLPLVPVKKGNLLKVIALEDAKNPPIGGTHPVDRQARTLMIYLPPKTKSGSIVLVSDGIHGQYVDGVNIPLVIVGGSGS